MMPTLSRAALNNADDIIREVGLAKSPARVRKSGGSALSQCTGKISFADFHLAETAAYRSKGRAAYRCRYCHQWHVGGRQNR